MDRTPKPRRAPGGLARAAIAIGTASLVALLAGCLPPGGRGAASGGTRASASSASALTATPAPTGPRTSPSFVAPTPTPQPTFLVYTVKSGDNLDSIAHRFGTTGRSIAYWNGATYPSLDPESDQYAPGLLKIGWTLRIVPNVTFDEQTLPEPSDLIDDTPSDAVASDGGD